MSSEQDIILICKNPTPWTGFQINHQQYKETTALYNHSIFPTWFLSKCWLLIMQYVIILNLLCWTIIRMKFVNDILNNPVLWVKKLRKRWEFKMVSEYDFFTKWVWKRFCLTLFKQVHWAIFERFFLEIFELLKAIRRVRKLNLVVFLLTLNLKE